MRVRWIAARLLVILGIVASVGESEPSVVSAAPGGERTPTGEAEPGASQRWYAYDELANPGAEVLAEGGVVVRTFKLSLRVPETSEAGYSSFFEFSLEDRDPTVPTAALLTVATVDGFVLDAVEWRSPPQALFQDGLLEVENVLPGCVEGVVCSTLVVVTVEATSGDLDAGWYTSFAAEDNTEADGGGEESRGIGLDLVIE